MQLATSSTLFMKLQYSNVTKRNKLLSFIQEQGSRQEYEPLLAVDCGFAEPLHNSNNAWAYFHRLMLETALSKSGITGQRANKSTMYPQIVLLPFTSQF
jgi:hypothetical protein